MFTTLLNRKYNKAMKNKKNENNKKKTINNKAANKETLKVINDIIEKKDLIGPFTDLDDLFKSLDA